MRIAELEVVARKWGNSIGFTLPKDVVKAKSIREGKILRIQIQEPLKRPKPGAFGGLKGWKIDAQKMKDQLRIEHEW